MKTIILAIFTCISLSTTSFGSVSGGNRTVEDTDSLVKVWLDEAARASKGSKLRKKVSRRAREDLVLSQEEIRGLERYADSGRVHIAQRLPKGYRMLFKWGKVLPGTVIEGISRLQTYLFRSVMSNDKNFRAFSDFVYFNVQDSILHSGHPFFYGNHDEVLLSPNYRHLSNVRGDLQHSTGKRKFNRDSVDIHYYTRAESREMFNADTVITYPMNMFSIHRPNGVFLDKYDRLRVFVVHRRDRGYFALYCFTNDIGERDFDKHFKAMQQIFRYKDD